MLRDSTLKTGILQFNARLLERKARGDDCGECVRALQMPRDAPTVRGVCESAFGPIDFQRLHRDIHLACTTIQSICTVPSTESSNLIPHVLMEILLVRCGTQASDSNERQLMRWTKHIPCQERKNTSKSLNCLILAIQKIIIRSETATTVAKLLTVMASK